MLRAGIAAVVAVAVGAGGLELLLRGALVTTGGPSPRAALDATHAAAATHNSSPTIGPAVAPPTVAWRPIPSPGVFKGAGAIQALAVRPDGQLVAGGAVCRTPLQPKSCSEALWTSTDGLTWTAAVGPNPDGDGATITAIGPGSKGMVAFSVPADAKARPPSGTTLTWLLERDGQMRVLGKGPTGTSLRSLVQFRDSLVAVGSQTTTGLDAAGVWLSGDGTAWKPSGPGTTGGGGAAIPAPVHVERLVDVVADPGGLVAVGSSCLRDGSACRALVWSSADGIAWTPAVLSGADGDGTADSIAAGLGGYVAGGDDGGGHPRMWTSADGLAWRLAAMPAGDGSIGSITWAGRAYIATGVIDGRQPAAWISRDGSSWSPLALPNGLAAPTAVAANGQMVFVAGTDMTTNLPAVWPGTLNP